MAKPAVCVSLRRTAGWCLVGSMEHDLVPQGRLKVVQDCVAAHFQPSPFDKLRAGSAGLNSKILFLAHILKAE